MKLAIIISVLIGTVVLSVTAGNSKIYAAFMGGFIVSEIVHCWSRKNPVKVNAAGQPIV